MAMPLGMTLVGVQMLSARNDMFNNVYVNLQPVGTALTSIFQVRNCDGDLDLIRCGGPRFDACFLLYSFGIGWCRAYSTGIALP